MTLGTLLVLIGVVIAALSWFFNSRVPYLLHVAVVLIGLGVLCGVTPLIKA